MIPSVSESDDVPQGTPPGSPQGDSEDERIYISPFWEEELDGGNPAKWALPGSKPLTRGEIAVIVRDQYEPRDTHSFIAFKALTVESKAYDTHFSGMSYREIYDDVLRKLIFVGGTPNRPLTLRQWSGITCSLYLAAQWSLPRGEFLELHRRFGAVLLPILMWDKVFLTWEGEGDPEITSVSRVVISFSDIRKWMDEKENSDIFYTVLEGVVLEYLGYHCWAGAPRPLTYSE
jgi:hypothetical protein